MRHSDIAYVLVLLQAGGEDCVLLHRHAKWGDWSLVGGHVEPGEEHDWLTTAAREAGEELAPLKLGGDFKVEPLWLNVEWGPQPSRSASGTLTEYRAQYFILRFLRDPQVLLQALPAADFRLVPVAALETTDDVSFPVRLLLERAGRKLQDLPRSWSADLRQAALT